MKSLRVHTKTAGSHCTTSYGRLTLGKLLCRIRKHQHLPEDLAHDLAKAVKARNDLAHAFFWPKDLENDERTENAAQTELMAAASLFSNLYPRLEAINVAIA